MDKNGYFLKKLFIEKSKIRKMNFPRGLPKNIKFYKILYT